MSSKYILRLYIGARNGQTEQSIEGLRRRCAERAHEACELDVIDVRVASERARQDGVLVTPTLIKVEPQPVRRWVGDLAGMLPLVGGAEAEKLTGGMGGRRSHAGGVCLQKG